MKTDFSKEIYETYYNIPGRIILITLANNNVLEGRFVGFFHGDEDAGEPFIRKWHFISVAEIEKHSAGLDISLEMNQDFGRVIDQKDIKKVCFKD
jgi:hypothetical protein